MAFALVPRGTTQRDAVIERAVVADPRGFTDHDSHPMVDEKTPADGGARVNFNPGQPAADVGDEARQPFQAPAPQPMREPMEKQCVKSRVAGDDLPGGTCGRVPVKYHANLFTNSAK